MDKILFMRRDNGVILVAQVYVDDIVFGSTCSHHAHTFEEEIKNEFEMSIVGELTLFLGL